MKPRLSSGDGREHGQVEDGEEDAGTSGGDVGPADRSVVEQGHEDEDGDDDGLGDETAREPFVQLTFRGPLEVESHYVGIGVGPGHLDRRARASLTATKRTWSSQWRGQPRAGGGPRSAGDEEAARVVSAPKSPSLSETVRSQSAARSTFLGLRAWRDRGRRCYSPLLQVRRSSTVRVLSARAGGRSEGHTKSAGVGP